MMSLILAFLIALALGSFIGFVISCFCFKVSHRMRVSRYKKRHNYLLELGYIETSVETEKGCIYGYMHETTDSFIELGYNRLTSMSNTEFKKTLSAHCTRI